MSDVAAPDRVLGPLLILDGIADGRLNLAAIFLAPPGTALAPVLACGQSVAPLLLADLGTHHVLRARFQLPCDRPSGYDWDGTRFDLACDLGGDLRIAFVSCNGEETGDMERDETERNVMWARLRKLHAEAPFALMLHGGDQIYADEATRDHPLSDGWPKEIPRDPLPEDLEDLRAHLRARFLGRYAAQLAQADYAWLVARVPSLAQWDDHDICDGWGSLPRSRTYSPVGQLLFAVAREMALLFQHGTVDGDLPARFTDPLGYHLGWQVAAPGLRILGPDLRSERTRRQVMGEAAWASIERQAAEPFRGRTLVVSSVPLLGPRLSILEALMVVTPRMQHYEDDLRDQWQSRAHRASWRRMLSLMLRMLETEGQAVTVLSGEIHLATRATMGRNAGAPGAPLHQLVASGITHRAPPKAWARALHALAALGEAPLPGHPVRIHAIPGRRSRYVAERNLLVLERHAEAWRAVWHFEESGASPALRI